MMPNLRRLGWALAGVLAVATSFWLWHFEYYGVGPRRAGFATPPLDPRVTAALDQRVDYDTVDDAELQTVLADLSRTCGVPIALSTAARQELGLTGAELLDFRVTQLPLRTLLRYVASEVHEELCVVAGEDGIRFGVERYERVTRTYPLAGMLLAARSVHERQIADLLPPDKSQCEIVPGGLIVSATPDVHELFADCLAKLESLWNDPTATEPVPVMSRTISGLPALSRRLEVEYIEQSRQDICRDLGKRFGVSIVLSNRAAIGIGRNEPLTCLKHEGTLAELLPAILRGAELAYVVDDELLIVTPVGRASDALSTTLYPVADLLRPDGEQTESNLVDVVKSVASPASWSDAGGVGAVGPCGGVIVASNSADVHRKVSALLMALRRISVAPVGTCEALPGDFDTVPDWRKRLVSLDLDDAPLAEFKRQLESQLGIKVAFDDKSTREIGIDLADVRLTFHTKAERFDFALQALLEPELTVVHRDGHLIVCAADSNCPFNVPRLYRVPRLPRGLSKFADAKYSGRHVDLVHVIKQSIASNTFDDAGGPGAIDSFGNVLIVSQTRDIQEQIERFLAALPQLCEPSARRNPIDFDIPENVLVREALRRPARLQAAGVTLGEFANDVARRCGIRVRIHRGDPEILVRGESAAPTLSAALERLLTPLEFDHRVFNGAIWLCPRDLSLGYEHLQFHRVDNLLNFDSNEELEQFVSVCGGWSGGQLAGWLAVTGTENSHERFEELLALLRRRAAGEKGTLTDGESPQGSLRLYSVADLRDRITADMPASNPVRRLFREHRVYGQPAEFSYSYQEWAGLLSTQTRLAHVGDSLAVWASTADHALYERILADVRGQLIAEPLAEPPVVRVLDLRPLLRRHPRLDPFFLLTVMDSVVDPCHDRELATWPRPIRRLEMKGFAFFGPYLLVASRDQLVPRTERLLAVLMKEDFVNDLVGAGDAQVTAAAQVVAAALGTDDSFRRAVLIALLVPATPAFALDSLDALERHLPRRTPFYLDDEALLAALSRVRLGGQGPASPNRLTVATRLLETVTEGGPLEHLILRHLSFQERSQLGRR